MGWLSMAPGLCVARRGSTFPLAPKKHWLLLSETLWCRAKQMSVELEGIIPGQEARGGTDEGSRDPARQGLAGKSGRSGWRSDHPDSLLLVVSEASEALETLSEKRSSEELKELLTPLPSVGCSAPATAWGLRPAPSTGGCSTTMGWVS